MTIAWSGFVPLFRVMAAAAVMALAAPVLVQCEIPLAQAKGSATMTAPHVAATALIVETRNGKVEIVPDAARGDVLVEAALVCAGDSDEDARQRLAQTVVSVERDDQQALMIKPVFPGGARNGDGASLVVRLPDALGVKVRTSNGSVQVKGMGGSLDVLSTNGAITVADHRGAGVVRTTNGKITVDSLGGSLQATTTNGPIVASNVAGQVKATSTNGSLDVELSDDQPGPLKVATTNGSIRVSVGPAFLGDLKLRTTNGSIKVDDPASRITSRDLGKRTGTLTFGAGGEASSVTTTNGRITVTAK